MHNISPDIILEYHAHVYFEEGRSNADKAKLLQKSIEEQFGQCVEVGRWHKSPIGPHPTGSYQVKFAAKNFQEFVQWLSLNSNGLSILIHPETGNELADHRDHPLWLGAQLKLDLSIF